MERNSLIFKRLSRLWIVFLLLAFWVTGKIIFVKLTRDSDADEKIAFRVRTLQPIRGDILSYDGRTLATSVPYYKVRLDCKVSSEDTFNKYIDGLCKALSEYFRDKTPAQYKKMITQGRAKGKRYLALNNRTVDYTELAKIRQFPLLSLRPGIGGYIAEEIYKRTNPYGKKAYRTIGYINSQGVGVGIEGTCDYYLKGTEGMEIQQKVLGGEWIPTNNDQNVLPQDGYDIRTTIDIDLQEAVENALKEQLTKTANNVEGATAVVMERKTGAIRAIANLKNDGRGGFDESLNYAIGQATEPGSVLKLATLVAVLEDGYVTLDSKISGGNGIWYYTYANGKGKQKVTDSHAVGETNVKGAFAHSSNVCFAKLSTTYYEKNPKKFVDRIQNMKLGEKFNLDIQGEASSVIIPPTSKYWNPGLLASMGFGYGMLITPLHTLTFYNAIANDGKMMRPYFIESHEKGGEVVKRFGPSEVSGAICSKETAKKAQEALRAVVTDGTGKMMKNDNYHISGKTGTARIAFREGGYERNGLRRYQATFCGFFPTEDPQYSVIVVLYSGPTAGTFYGASQAGPVFKQIADFLYANSPQWNELIDANKGKLKNEKLTLDPKQESRLAGKIAISGDSIADVTEMGIRDALYILENQGYKVKFKGNGKVVAQTPAAGSRAEKNSVVTLDLAN